jgi:hypothetical protein
MRYAPLSIPGTMSQYRKTSNYVGGEQSAAHTRARLDTIRTHLEVAPRTGKLKGKTCVITGTGSLKGIGSVRVISRLDFGYPSCFIHRRSTALLFAHEGGCHTSGRGFCLLWLIRVSGSRSRCNPPLPLGFRARQSPRTEGYHSTEIPGC